jgi:hypothetical protein
MIRRSVRAVSQWLSLIAVVLMIPACVRAGVPDPSGQEDIYLEADLDRPVVEPGEIATITFGLESVAATPVTLYFNSGCQIMPYVAEADTGTVVYPDGGSWACTMALTTLELPSGETESRVLRVRAGEGDTEADVTLPPGEYVAHARLEDRVYQLVSTSVPFTVR